MFPLHKQNHKLMDQFFWGRTSHVVILKTGCVRSGEGDILFRSYGGAKIFFQRIEQLQSE